jgi:Holliday junction DNA helicase RuvA
MFEYLHGVVTMVAPAYIVLDCQGIGYKLFCPAPYAYHEGQKAQVFVEQVVRDDGISLYGFIDAQAKGLFLKLLSVNGIGPKSALAIMAAEDNDSLASAIEQGEVKYLTKFPGIGKKTAAQIILDLKGKLGDYVARIDSKGDQELSPELEDALQALSALGYTKRDLEKITAKLQASPAKTADELTKAGLALLLKK